MYVVEGAVKHTLPVSDALSNTRLMSEASAGAASFTVSFGMVSIATCSLCMKSPIFVALAVARSTV